ncbi:efflux transporter outer membrane subunit [Methylomonas sp. HYX-M1]|uniref:efflux transporter outer membrane subunit n=1 Tax=Methylomonas sp. HYX-M1 TaxID=3139307 RepID=UPI00345BFF0F
MLQKPKRFIAAACLALTAGACSQLDTELSIQKPELPAEFSGYKDAGSSVRLAEIDWRDYFSDPQLIVLIDAAVSNNPDLQMALQRIEASRSSVKLANAALLPKVDLAIGGGMRKFGQYTMDGAGNATTDITPGNTVPEVLPDIFVGLQSSWEIDVWGKLRNQRSAAASSYLSSIDAANFVISNLVADVAIYYNELLALDHELDIIRATIRKEQEALDVIKWQKEAGRANELAVQQFQAEVLNTQVSEKNALQHITEIENKINFLLGRYPQPIPRSKEVFFVEPNHRLAAGVPSQLLENRPDIRAAEFDIQASQFDLQAAKAAFYPNVNITATFGFQAFDPEFLFQSPASLAYSVFGQLITPLVNKNALEARFNTAKATQLTAMYNYQKTILNAYVEVANQLSNLKNLQQVSALKRQQSDALRHSVEVSNELYKAAKATYLEVLYAQQSALRSNLELINATKQRHVAGINLYKALGGGWQ